MPEAPDLRLAVFGESGAGKTVFFSSYYGNQSTQEFERRHLYRLEAALKTQGNTLLSRYQRLAAGKFPDATDGLSEYRFKVQIAGLSEPGMFISWTDYPGRWIEKRPKSEAERIERDTEVAKLLSSHALILLLDGERYLDQGELYLRTILHRYQIMIHDIKTRLSQQGSPLDVFPKVIILAMTKADLLPALDAESISRVVLQEAVSEINQISAQLGTAGRPAPFPTHVLLLSSVHSPDKTSIDPSNTVGLDLIVPLSLAATLDEVARKADRNQIAGFLSSILKGLASIVHLVDHLDDFLPKRYQLITALLKLMPLEALARSGSDELQRRHTEAVNRKDALAAAATAMSLTLNRANATRAYYRVQG